MRSTPPCLRPEIAHEQALVVVGYRTTGWAVDGTQPPFDLCNLRLRARMTAFGFDSDNSCTHGKCQILQWACDPWMRTRSRTRVAAKNEVPMVTVKQPWGTRNREALEPAKIRVGAGDGIRTRDPLLGKQLRYHCATPAEHLNPTPKTAAGQAAAHFRDRLRLPLVTTTGI
jgi:hypothetical protein